MAAVLVRGALLRRLGAAPVRALGEESLGMSWLDLNKLPFFLITECSRTCCVPPSLQE